MKSEAFREQGNVASQPTSTFGKRAGNWVLVYAVVVTLVVVVVSSPSARASSSGGGCVNGVQSLGSVNGSSNVTASLCPGVQPDFTTNQWNTGWSHLNVNTQPCNGNSNSYSSNYDYNGGLYATEYVRADGSVSGCTPNIAEVNINVGLHGATFSAWKAGNAYYTVVANFTYKDNEATATYCQSGGIPSAKANISTLTAMYDNNLGTGVGASNNNGGYETVVIWQTCNNAWSYQDHGTAFQAKFTTSVAIAQYDQLVPRGSVTADVWVNSPSTYPSASHAASQLDFNNDGYGYITLNSIWVY